MNAKQIKSIMGMPNLGEYVEQHTGCPEVLPTIELVKWLHGLIRHQLHLECTVLRDQRVDAPPNLFMAAFSTILERWEIRRRIEDAGGDWRAGDPATAQAAELTEKLAVKVLKQTLEWLMLWLGPLELAEATYQAGHMVHPANITLQDDVGDMLQDLISYWADAATVPVLLDPQRVALVIEMLRSDLVHGATGECPFPLVVITAVYVGYCIYKLAPERVVQDDETFARLVHQAGSIIFAVIQALEWLVDQGCLTPPSAVGDA